MKLGFGIDIKKKKVIKEITKPYYILRSFNKQKVFCIGFNKTGTTSLEKAMRDLGFIVGDQREAELLFDDWIKRDYRKLIKYCKTAVFFQDSPFSHPYTFIAIDQAFPGSKFILTVRDNADQWYDSLIRYHSKLWGKGKIPPTSEDLKNARYIYKGRPYHTRIHTNNVTEEVPYDKRVLIDNYNMHIKNVKDYFRFRHSDLLVLNVAEPNAYKKLTTFLNIQTDKTEFPWENKTDEK